MDDDRLRKKVAANEALLREANEAIERGLWPGDESRVVRFRCECAELECNQTVEITVQEYEQVRANPRRFFMMVGHERPEAEAVVERHADHVVVEKLGEGGELADATDPRD